MTGSHELVSYQVGVVRRWNKIVTQWLGHVLVDALVLGFKYWTFVRVHVPYKSFKGQLPSLPHCTKTKGETSLSGSHSDGCIYLKFLIASSEHCWRLYSTTLSCNFKVHNKCINNSKIRYMWLWSWIAVVQTSERK